jgi:hypothetical protein
MLLHYQHITAKFWSVSRITGENRLSSTYPTRELLVYSEIPRTINSSAFLLQFDDDRRMI